LLRVWQAVLTDPEKGANLVYEDSFYFYWK
jgi:hypothetical protein